MDNGKTFPYLLDLVVETQAIEWFPISRTDSVQFIGWLNEFPVRCNSIRPECYA